MGSRGHEHLDRGLHSYPCASLRNWSRQMFWWYPPGITLCFSGSTLGTVPMVSPQGTVLSIERSNSVVRVPHEALVRARSQAVILRADHRKVKVTIDCYSEKRRRPSQWSGGAPTEARAWGALQWQYKRQDKSHLHSRNRSIFFGPEIWGYTNIRSPLSNTHRSVSPSFSPSW